MVKSDVAVKFIQLKRKSVDRNPALCILPRLRKGLRRDMELGLLKNHPMIIVE